MEVAGNISSAFDVREQKRLWLNTMLVQCAPIECFQSWKLGKPNWCATTMRFDDHVRLAPTPGHTPHHVAVCLGRDGDDAVMPGDVLHSPRQARYPEISPRFDVDKDASAKTRRNFLERCCDTRTVCCTAHFPSPSIGRVPRWDDGFRCDSVEP